MEEEMIEVHSLTVSGFCYSEAYSIKDYTVKYSKGNHSV